MEEINLAKRLPKLRIHSYNVFDSYGGYEIQKLYCSFFRKIASTKKVKRINIKEAIEWVETNLAERIVQKISNEYDHDDQYHNDVAFILTEEILIFLDYGDDSSNILYNGDEKEAQTIWDNLKQFKNDKETEQSIYIVALEDRGLCLKSLKNPKPQLSIKRNYNDDLELLHTKVLQELNSENRSGIMLFHGMPGTGKSTYLRYLLSCVKKKIIFIAPRIAANMDDPRYSHLLIEHPNSVVIIEDAEELLVSRNRESNSGISTLLNLSDGLLGSSLNIQFICTFNTHLNNIDSALLRKGRLKALYEFKPLSIEKSKALLIELDKEKINVTEPMTLADIYNMEETNFEFEPKRKKIGFNVEAA